MQPSLPSSHSLVVDASLWASPLAVRLGTYAMNFFSPVMLPSEIPKLPTDMPVREFPAVWKLLLHDSLPRKGLHP